MLLARNEVIHRQPEGYVAFRGAVSEACRFCDQAENRRTVADILDEARIFPVAKEILMNSLVGPFHTGVADLTAKGPFLVFHQGGANEATRERAAWCLEAVSEAGTLGLMDGAANFVWRHSWMKAMPVMCSRFPTIPRQCGMTERVRRDEARNVLRLLARWSSGKA